MITAPLIVLNLVLFISENFSLSKEQVSPSVERSLISDLETLDLFGTLPRTKKTIPAPKKPNPSTRANVVFQDPLLGNLDEESLDDIFKS